VFQFEGRVVLLVPTPDLRELPLEFAAGYIDPVVRVDHHTHIIAALHHADVDLIEQVVVQLGIALV